MKNLMLAWLAAFVLGVINDGKAVYEVTSDSRPAPSLTGPPMVPAGAVVTVKAEDGGSFAVRLTTPLRLDEASASGSWSRRLSDEGGYRLEAQGDPERIATPLQFSVIPPEAMPSSSP